MAPNPTPQAETLIERLIGVSARNAFLIVLFTLFGVAGGIYALTQIPLDAIPDQSDIQVIVYTDWEGRSPDLVEDQITYPISTKFIAAPKVKFVRAESMFGKSFVYVIFQDGTNIYWARSRVIEYLNSVRDSLPESVNPVIGPDATGVGWVFEYALVDESGKHNLAELRSFQDWHLKYALESVPGVAEVASVGGFVKEYQVDVDPNKLLAYNIPLSTVVNSIRSSNADVGGKTFEVSSTQFFVRGRGYIKDVRDIENVVLATQNGTPVYIKNVAAVHLGPDLRYGVTDLDGKGEVVGGVVVMRYGENALKVIDGVKKKLEEVRSSFPPGMGVIVTYDRSTLIYRAIDTLREKLIEESIVVALVCILFLWHLRSALVAIITLPIAIIVSFLPLYWLGLTSNIMSLGGIAIAIGAMIDAAIIMVENAHKALEHFREEQGRDPGPRSSNHQCSEPSICTSSPRQSRRARGWRHALQPVLPPNPKAGANHPLPQRLDPEIQTMKLGQLLGRQGRTKIAVALTHDGQHGLAEHQTPSPIARPAALPRDQTVRAAGAERIEQPVNLSSNSEQPRGVRNR